MDDTQTELILEREKDSASSPLDFDGRVISLSNISAVEINQSPRSN